MCFSLLSLRSLALVTWQQEVHRVFQSLPAVLLGPAHCALEAVVVVEAAPLAEATVKREFWTDSAEVEVA